MRALMAFEAVARTSSFRAAADELNVTRSAVSHQIRALEEQLGKPIVSSDFALYWNIFKTLGVAPEGDHGRLLATLK